ncbi:UNVERIFIED_ORG: hypothetical protein OKW25_002989 [Pseudomonas vranovensis]|nr:hypothetical protein [Pseudomonas vranovensis]
MRNPRRSFTVVDGSSKGPRSGLWGRDCSGESHDYPQKNRIADERPYR